MASFAAHATKKKGSLWHGTLKRDADTQDNNEHEILKTTVVWVWPKISQESVQSSVRFSPDSTQKHIVNKKLPCLAVSPVLPGDKETNVSQPELMVIKPTSDGHSCAHSQKMYTGDSGRSFLCSSGSMK